MAAHLPPPPLRRPRRTGPRPRLAAHPSKWCTKQPSLAATRPPCPPLPPVALPLVRVLVTGICTIAGCRTLATLTAPVAQQLMPAISFLPPQEAGPGPPFRAPEPCPAACLH